MKDALKTILLIANIAIAVIKAIEKAKAIDHHPESPRRIKNTFQ